MKRLEAVRLGDVVILVLTSAVRRALTISAARARSAAVSGRLSLQAMCADIAEWPAASPDMCIGHRVDRRVLSRRISALTHGKSRGGGLRDRRRFVGSCVAAAIGPSPPCPTVPEMSVPFPCAAASASSTIATPAALCRIIVSSPLLAFELSPPPPINEYAPAIAGLHEHPQGLYDSAATLRAIGSIRAVIEDGAARDRDHYRQWFRKRAATSQNARVSPKEPSANEKRPQTMACGRS